MNHLGFRVASGTGRRVVCMALAMTNKEIRGVTCGVLYVQELVNELAIEDQGNI